MAIVAMDINPAHLVTTSLLADEFERVPLSAATEFPAVLINVLKRYSVDTYLPLLPEEIVIAARLREAGELPDGLCLLAPSVRASEICGDKWRLSQRLREHGVATPRTSLTTDPFPAQEYFMKPRDGTGSRGARRVRARELSSLGCAAEAGLILQEVCQPPEVTVDAFVDPERNWFRAVARERLEIKSGVSTKCRLFEDEILAGYAVKIGRALYLRGSFCFQVMRRGEEWVVTDVNPRPGAATAMCSLVGNDFFAATFALAWGLDVQQFFRPLDRDYFVTRQYAEFLMPPPL